MRLLMLVEGQSEETFVRRSLAPYLAPYGVFVECTVLKTKRPASGPSFRGGVSTWSRIEADVRRLLHNTDARVTTMLDFYGLPDDFPGYLDSVGKSRPRDQVENVQRRFAESIDNRRFIPFLVLHEFEAWVFSEPKVVAVHYTRPEVEASIQAIVDSVGEPEMINHGRDTHPKARLLSLGLSYKPTSDGPLILDKIGPDAIAAACPHFAKWLNLLKALGED